MPDTATIPALLAAPDGYDQDDVDAACAAVRGLCGWHVAPLVTETVTTTGDGSPFLQLRTQRLVTVADVTNRGIALTPSQWTEAGRVLLPFPYYWCPLMNSVQLTITHGYDACPADLKSVILSMAKRGAASGVTRRIAGPYATFYNPAAGGGVVAVDPEHVNVITRYAFPGLG